MLPKRLTGPLPDRTTIYSACLSKNSYDFQHHSSPFSRDDPSIAEWQNYCGRHPIAATRGSYTPSVDKSPNQPVKCWKWLSQQKKAEQQAASEGSQN